MTTLHPHWARTFAFRWLITLALHTVALHVLAGSGIVSAMFSPGAHISRTTILVVGLFLVLRVYVMLLWPAALISLVAWLHAGGAARRRATLDTVS